MYLNLKKKQKITHNQIDRRNEIVNTTSEIANNTQNEKPNKLTFYRNKCDFYQKIVNTFRFMPFLLSYFP